MDLERSNVLLICFAESKGNLTLRFYFRELLAGSEMVRKKKKKAANVMILSPIATIYGTDGYISHEDILYCEFISL